ncbi:Major Facilitator Superfamily protein [Loktanella fryxellensis]|uniref:Major Facilitator Superfamily protein n=2 Tax=Loktanella fryxellensis TaxID=245187 RepID=A0A1H8ILL5_9RHOB|nr:MFS transporter [Loktanella fryxellensis]SEN68618.1 Major Facilitator Superfamily protein [Loktanella fryxellensis]
MIAPRAPLYLTHAPTPQVRDFATLAALEACIRAMLLSVMPLVIYRAYGDAGTVSLIYLLVGVGSMICGLMVPYVGRLVPRRWMLTLACGFYLAGAVLALTTGPQAKALVLLFNAVGTVTFTVCLNAYVLDYIARLDLGRNESTRMVYSAVPWSVGPVLGVTLLDWWAPAPFLLAGAFALILLAMFWRLRLGDGRQIARAQAPAPNPLAYLGRFAAQPRLIAGWFFAVMRSCGWWVYIVYLPIFCIEAGLGPLVGAAALSLSNAMLFTTPLMMRRVRRVGVRKSVRIGFGWAGCLFATGFALSHWPWAAVACIMAGSVGLVLLDVCGGLPFLMSVRPAERTDMVAVYATFRDASGIATPAAASVVLLVLPVAGLFAVCGAGMAVGWLVAGRLHPRLGLPRLSPAGAAR